MPELLAKFDGGELIGLLSVLMGGLIAITAIVSVHWRKARRAEQDAALKQQMIERGMSAEQIAQVLAASSKSPKDHDEAPALRQTIDHARS